MLPKYKSSRVSRIPLPPRIISFKLIGFRYQSISRLRDARDAIAAGRSSPASCRAERLLYEKFVPLNRQFAANSLAVCSGRAAPLAVALAHPGMILIHKAADVPVIMGISKPAGLKSQHREGENDESTIRWH